jgi:uncharacterized protein YbjQ (UPF0145 family)
MTDPKTIKLLSIESIPTGLEPLGLVRGSTARSRNITRDITAVIKNVVGGEVKSYTQLMADAREEAIYRMQEDAVQLNATMVVGVRFASSMITQGVSEMVAWGTAVGPTGD